MKSALYFWMVLVVLVLCESQAGAIPHRKIVPLPCRVVGVVPLQKYFRRHEGICFKHMRGALSEGFLPYENGTPTKSALKPPPHCKALAIPELGVSFREQALGCFRSKQNAERKGFSYFFGNETATSTPNPTRTTGNNAVPTPAITPTGAATLISRPTSTALPTRTPTLTPSPTATRTPQNTATNTPTRSPSPTRTQTATPTFTFTPTPTATSTAIPLTTPSPSPSAMPTEESRAFSFNLFPANGHNEYSGYCTATLSASRTNFVFTCTHNVAGATGAHLHLIDNTFLCRQNSPQSPFTISCTITTSQADDIEHTRALADVHIGEAQKGEDQVLAGFVVPPP